MLAAGCTMQARGAVLSQQSIPSAAGLRASGARAACRAAPSALRSVGSSRASSSADRRRQLWRHAAEGTTGGAAPAVAAAEAEEAAAAPPAAEAAAPEQPVVPAANGSAEVAAPPPEPAPPVAPATSSSKGVPTSDVWELDFCSRPILDERGKKVWELIICDPQRSFEYALYYPNNKINSTELKKALEAVLAQPGAVKPASARFFRGQMQTIISRALSDLGIAPVPSRRCFTLMNWLEERMESVYQSHPGYSPQASSLFTLDLGAPQELPDALRGEKWSFVQLPLATLQQELNDVEAGRCFGATLDANALPKGAGPDTLVPGVAVYSRRADPLAAWTNGLDLASVVADTDRAFLILETGFNDRWRYGAYRRSLETTAEATAWEEAKQAVGGLHFLAVMPDEDSEVCSGLWLLLDRKPPNV